MTLDAFQAKYPDLIDDVAALSEQDRRAFLKGHAEQIKARLGMAVCANCGAIDEPWCCYKSPGFRELMGRGEVPTDPMGMGT